MAKKAALYLTESGGRFEFYREFEHPSASFVGEGERARHLPPYATRWLCERSVKYNGYNNTLPSGTNP